MDTISLQQEHATGEEKKQEQEQEKTRTHKKNKKKTERHSLPWAWYLARSDSPTYTP